MAGDGKSSTVAAPSTTKLPSFAVNAIVLGALSLTEEYIIEGEFRCPCRDEKEKGVCDAPNYYSGMVLAGPAVVVFMLTLAGRWAFRVTCCVSRNDDEKNAESKPCCEVRYTMNIFFWLAQAFFLALGWVAITLVDGRYIACAEGCPTLYNQTCSQVKHLSEKKVDLVYSDNYKQKESASQMWGHVLLLVLGLLYFLCVIYDNCICRCRKPCGKCHIDDMCPCVNFVKETKRDPTLAEICEGAIGEVKKKHEEVGRKGTKKPSTGNTGDEGKVQDSNC